MVNNTDLHVLEKNTPAPFVLEGHQLIRMLALLFAVLFEEVGESRKCNVVTGKIKGLKVENTINIRLHMNSCAIFKVRLLIAANTAMYHILFLQFACNKQHSCLYTTIMDNVMTGLQWNITVNRAILKFCQVKVMLAVYDLPSKCRCMKQTVPYWSFGWWLPRSHGGSSGESEKSPFRQFCPCFIIKKISKKIYFIQNVEQRRNCGEVLDEGKKFRSSTVEARTSTDVFPKTVKWQLRSCLFIVPEKLRHWKRRR